MRSSAASDLVATGLGVTTPIGQGKAAFVAALLAGNHAFGVMQRPGRTRGTAFLGAEIANLRDPAFVAARPLRTASYSARVTLATVAEAWQDAHLADMDPARVALVIGGWNVQQRDLVQTHEAYRDREEFVPPPYGLSFLDSDAVALCDEQLDIRGPGYTIGGASASGQLAIIHAANLVLTGQADACIAVGALMDLSHWECSALRAMGAMGSDRHASSPHAACRPFDRDHDGFIFGECCGAVVIESSASASERRARPYAGLSGWSVVMDGKRTPEPSLDGEIAAIRRALRNADCSPEQIDYVNPHGSGSILGDETEAAAIRACSLAHARINTTKSLTGHGLSAAGAVEVVATLLQMRSGRLHPCRNLEEPIDPALHWVRALAEPHTMRHALTLSMGFGGINTAMCWRHDH
jgi:malonyl-[acp] decarboxylase